MDPHIYLLLYHLILDFYLAYAMLYRDNQSPEDWERFKTITDYTLSHFSNGAGEWFGYLDRRGDVTHRFKGGPYKGCFHVPRALYFVLDILKSIVLINSSTPSSSNLVDGENTTRDHHDGLHDVSRVDVR